MNENTDNLIEITNNVEYVYVSIPREYICVYHKILVMLADYGIDMLKDCKASCTDKNTNIIECFNMFNAAVAAKKLGKTSLANTLITYVKAKINSIYKEKDNSPSFIFPIDENGELKAFVTCNDPIRLFIDPNDGNLYNRIFRTNGGIQEQFILGTEEYPQEPTIVPEEKPFDYDVSYNLTNIDASNCEITISINNLIDKNGNTIDINDCTIGWQLDGNYYTNLNSVIIPKRNSVASLDLVIYYNNIGVMHTMIVDYNI